MAEDEHDYKVGPGRPPLRTRFRKGQSGNPGGRSKKNLPAYALHKVSHHLLVRFPERAGSGAGAATPAFCSASFIMSNSILVARKSAVVDLLTS